MHIYKRMMTNFGLMMPYGGIYLSQHRLRSGLVPNGTKSQTEAMFIFHLWSSVVFTWKQFNTESPCSFLCNFANILTAENLFIVFQFVSCTLTYDIILYKKLTPYLYLPYFYISNSTLANILAFLFSIHVILNNSFIITCTSRGVKFINVEVANAYDGRTVGWHCSKADQSNCRVVLCAVHIATDFEDSPVTACGKIHIWLNNVMFYFMTSV